MTDKHAPPSYRHPKRRWLGGSVAAAVNAFLTACGIQPPSQTPAIIGPGSHATTPRAYRSDAARHLYARNAQRIFKGQLPPLLHAVGTLEVNVGRKGEVRSLNWLRKPHHAPDVVREIERTVRAAAPFPVAHKLGFVTYTDTWLWDRSGHFQLDTLTEGQRD